MFKTALQAVNLALLLNIKLTSGLVEHDELSESSLSEFAPIGGLSLPRPNQVVAGRVEQLLPDLIIVPSAEINSNCLKFEQPLPLDSGHSSSAIWN
ncbi:hypothetical protein WR25_25480 [Diploscapter pachys]|uniref:Uncharacterized protein n=1 Tax=Diploscapter pachys TaxID=2018661 RepID=A0A2A2KUS9_9BILA|nr:hypothetical protein WR25_25480 [Diploscapter pachys]